MADDWGNEELIGIAPNGFQDHVVVPVDWQIARGLKFWIQPDDGTPFGRRLNMSQNEEDISQNTQIISQNEDKG